MQGTDWNYGPASESGKLPRVQLGPSLGLGASAHELLFNCLTKTFTKKRGREKVIAHVLSYCPETGTRVRQDRMSSATAPKEASRIIGFQQFETPPIPGPA